MNSQQNIYLLKHLLKNTKRQHITNCNSLEQVQQYLKITANELKLFMKNKMKPTTIAKNHLDNVTIEKSSEPYPKDALDIMNAEDYIIGAKCTHIIMVLFDNPNVDIFEEYMKYIKENIKNKIVSKNFNDFALSMWNERYEAKYRPFLPTDAEVNELLADDPFSALHSAVANFKYHTI
jgi:hypothetical protein